MNMEPTLPLGYTERSNTPVVHVNFHAQISAKQGTCWQCRWLWGPTDDRFMYVVCGADLYHDHTLPEHGCSRFKPGGDDEWCREG